MNLSVLIRAGNRTFGKPTNCDIGPSPWRYLAVGDVTGDGSADVINAEREKAQLVVRLGKRDGSFADPIFIDTGERRDYLYNPVIADFNADGRNDVAVALNYKGKVLVLLGAR